VVLQILLAGINSILFPGIIVCSVHPTQAETNHGQVTVKSRVGRDCYLNVFSDQPLVTMNRELIFPLFKRKRAVQRSILIVVHQRSGFLIPVPPGPNR
jgi:hypothetical protein